MKQTVENLQKKKSKFLENLLQLIGLVMQKCQPKLDDSRDLLVAVSKRVFLEGSFLSNTICSEFCTFDFYGYSVSQSA